MNVCSFLWAGTSGYLWEAFRLMDTLCVCYFCAKSYFYSAMRPHVVIFIVCPNWKAANACSHGVIEDRLQKLAWTSHGQKFLDALASLAFKLSQSGWVSKWYFFRSSVYTVCTVYTVYTITSDLLYSLFSRYSLNTLNSLFSLCSLWEPPQSLQSLQFIQSPQSLQSPQVNLAHHRVDFRAFLFLKWCCTHS